MAASESQRVELLDERGVLLDRYLGWLVEVEVRCGLVSARFAGRLREVTPSDDVQWAVVRDVRLELERDASVTLHAETWRALARDAEARGDLRGKGDVTHYRGVAKGAGWSRVRLDLVSPQVQQEAA
jgi:hypothetical protein